MIVPNLSNESAATNILREEIARFVVATRERSEYDADPRRRAQRRYHRSWPLLVSRGRQIEDLDLSVALHNASELGLAFLSSERFQLRETVFIKLFWHDPAALRVPARVRHMASVEHGCLVGCEFLLDDETQCKRGLDVALRWYDEAI